MKKIFYLVISLLMINTLSAQNKKLTLYYPDSIKVVNIAGLDSMTIFICGTSKVSYGGKDYNTVLIGDQCWLKENINIGTMTSPGNNGAIDKYCYNSLPANCDTYGGLYAWNEAMQYDTAEGVRGICPEGWHIPKISEFQILKDAVNDSSNALKKEDQGSGAGQGTNTSGFTALLSGYYANYFDGLGDFGNFWSSSSDSPNSNYVFNFGLNSYSNGISCCGLLGAPGMGLSVRCLKDQ